MRSTEPVPPVRRGLLILNLGTPDGAEAGPVRRYLREFLSDPRVVDLNPVGRWLLLNLIILPFRPRRSAHAYQQIWTPQGSPLLVHGRALTEAVAGALRGEFEVALGMRYGNPSIRSALEELQRRGVRELTVLPLYPQNAASTSGSSVAKVYEELARRFEVMPVEIVPAFFDDEGFLSAWEEVAKPALELARADHFLFSFHGVPERHVQKSDPTGSTCLAAGNCSERLTDANRTCYRAQCFATARLIAGRLKLPREQWTVSFQSRLGRTRWVHPYTDAVLPELAQRGVRRIAVFSPSFVADCLETLEELRIRGREQWLALGGEELTLIPSLNSHERWVEAVAALARRGARPRA